MSMSRFDDALEDWVFRAAALILLTLSLGLSLLVVVGIAAAIYFGVSAL